MNVRWFSLVVSLVVVIMLALGGCGPTPEPTEAPPTEAPPTEVPPTEAPPAEEPSAEGTPYKVGFCAAITGPGSSLGVPERNTAERLVEQYADGIVGPDGVHHDLEFIIYDTESNPDTAASVASRLITEDEVDVLVCGTLSGNSMAIVPIATENEIPLISMASARAIIEDPETGETRTWVFKTPQENLHSGEWQAQYLEAMGITQICDLYENTGYGQDCLAQTTAAVEAKGIEVVYSDTFERSDTEFPQMTGVQGSGCEAIVVGAIPPGASMVTVAAREVLPDAGADGTSRRLAVLETGRPVHALGVLAHDDERFLFAVQDGRVARFRGTADGWLEREPTTLPLDAAPRSLRLHPGERPVLLLLDPARGVVSYRVDPDGGPLGLVPGSPFSVGEPVTAMGLVEEGGPFVYLAGRETVFAFRLLGSGSLALIDRTSSPAGVIQFEASCDGGRLYGTSPGARTIRSWTIKANGALESGPAVQDSNPRVLPSWFAVR